MKLKRILVVCILFTSFCLFNMIYFYNEQKANLLNYPLPQIQKVSNDIKDNLMSSVSHSYYKEFNVTENTGADQTDVIIDPVSFTEDVGYCFKDSMRVFKSPYSPADEVISQVYNLETFAYQSFSTSSDWGMPNSWTLYAGYTDAIKVLPRYAGYKKVVQLIANETGQHCEMYHDFSLSATSGTYYITMRMNSTERTALVGLTAPVGYVIYFGLNESGKFFHCNSSTRVISTISYEADKWYTLKCVFDCSSDKYSLYYYNEDILNWSIIVENEDFREPTSSITRNHIRSRGNLHVAAIDGSWFLGFQEDRILYASSAQIAFIDNLTASETKDYRIYYNNSPTAQANYTNIQRNGYTINFTDGSSTILYCNDSILYYRDSIYQYDKNGNQHISGSNVVGRNMGHTELGGAGGVSSKPIISDGPIFIETWHADSASDWSYLRFYANSFTYKYHNFSGSGPFDWGVTGAENVIFDFEEIYFHQSGTWQNEIFDYTGISWQNHYETLDLGKLFMEDNGDSNILIALWEISQDSDSADILIGECNFPNPSASARVFIGNNATPPYSVINNNFGAWQFYQDVGSININDKQDFVDNLYNITIENPPTISIAGSRNNGSIFNYYKEFTVTENTGSDQTNVIIDPVNFTEEQGYCFKDSLRVYKSPYGVNDEMVSQVYNMEPYAWETFSNDSDWGYPNTNWPIINDYENCSIKVLPRFAGYKKVVEIYDNNNTQGPIIVRTFSSQTVGTYYITMMTSNITQGHQRSALGGVPGYLVIFGFNESGNFNYGSNFGWVDTGIPYETNKWYTFKCTFDCNTDKFSAWYWDEINLNWSSIANNADFYQPATSVTSHTIISPIPYYDGSLYVAAVDYSWQSGYQEDRILYTSSAQIAFIDNLTASETKEYRIYYSNSQTAPANYTNIVRNGYIVNFTDGGSAMMYVRLNPATPGSNGDFIRQFDENGNEHVGEGIYDAMTGVGNNITSWTDAEPIISDGPIFIESFQADDENDWKFYRFYANSYIYKFSHYPSVGAANYRSMYKEQVPIDFDAQYFRKGGSWTVEPFDNSGASWENHWHTLDKGIMFTDDSGDSNILINLWDVTQDVSLKELFMRECRFPPFAGDPALSIFLGRSFASSVLITHSFGIWQFFKNAGSTNINDKQNFVDNLYNVTIKNPPTISSLGPRNEISDTEIPNILEIYVNIKMPRPLDPLNITAHVTDNKEVSCVLLYTDLYGTFRYLEMNLIVGTTSDGYWSYNTTIPLNASKRTISYQIWANDSNGQINTSAIYQFKVKKDPKPIIIIPPGEDITIIIIIIIGSIATGIAAISMVLYKKSRTESKIKKIPKPKKKVISELKGKSEFRKNGIGLGAEAIRRILKDTEKTAEKMDKKLVEPPLKEADEFLDKKKEEVDADMVFMQKEVKMFTSEIYEKVRNLQNLTDSEKELLLKDLATIDPKDIKMWLKKFEEMED